MEQNALRAVIDLVENSQLVNLSELLQHRAIDECVTLMVPTEKPRRASLFKTLPSTNNTPGVLYCSCRYGHDN